METQYEPTSIGGYPILRRIGAGGMSTVFEAIDPSGMHVALKRLHPFVAEDPDSRARLRREVEVLKKLRGPHIAQILDAELDEAEIFIVTELIDGLTLLQEVQQNGRYTEEDLVQLGKDLAAALTAVHELGIVHRDLKPSNVMMSTRGPVLIDFGIAQSVDATRYTMQGMLAHTPGYCDPRVVRGAEPDMAADWWALAAVLAFAANGEPPFGREAAQILHRTVAGEVVLENLDAITEQIFTHALAPKLEERISFPELLHYLEFPESYLHDWGVPGEQDFGVVAEQDRAAVGEHGFASEGDVIAGNAVAEAEAEQDFRATGERFDFNNLVPETYAPDDVPTVHAFSDIAQVYASDPAPTIIESVEPTLIADTAAGASWNSADPGGYYRNLNTNSQLGGNQDFAHPQPVLTPQANLDSSVTAKPPRKLLRAPFITLYIGIFLSVIGVRWPGVIFLGYFALLVLLGMIGRSYQWQNRQLLPGELQTSSGVLQVLLRLPMNFVSALAATFLTYLFSGGLLYLLYRFAVLPNYQEAFVNAGLVDVLGQFQPQAAPFVIAAVFLWLAVIWFVLKGRYHRIGLRVVLTPLLPTPWFRFVWTGILLAGSALVYLTLVDVTQIDFAPFTAWLSR